MSLHAKWVENYKKIITLVIDFTANYARKETL
jgi:hypothetical protein